VLVAEHPAVARLALPDDGRLVFPAVAQVPVDAVIAGIELAAGEPLGVWLVPDQHLVPVPEPAQLFGLLPPEGFGVVAGLLPELFVLGQAANVRLGGKVRGRRKAPAFLEDAGNVRGGGRGHGKVSDQGSGVRGQQSGVGSLNSRFALATNHRPRTTV